jgi:flagellar motility protein MotE (MotC chaperone)
MGRGILIGVYVLSVLASVKLLSETTGLAVLSQALGLGSATAAESEAEVPADTAAPAPLPPALPELLAAIAVEHKELAERKAALDEREAEIELARAAVLKQNQELTALREDVSRLLDQAKATEAADVSRLVKIYQAMKPTEAAGILQDADLELAVLVLSAMSERNAGPIMAAMSSDRANAVSRVLLERSRLPGDQEPVVVQLN